MKKISNMSLSCKDKNEKNTRDTNEKNTPPYVKVLCNLRKSMENTVHGDPPFLFCAHQWIQTRHFHPCEQYFP